MTRYMFSISSGVGMRRMGVVQSDDFAGALSTLESQVTAESGDVLEIGVPGFPPARFQAVSFENQPVSWFPQGRLAA